MDLPVKNPIDIIFSEENRVAEEDYLRALISDNNLNLFYTSDKDDAFTDGVNIVINPLMVDLYKEKEILTKACRINGLPGFLFLDDYAALKFICRTLELHETFHVLYTDFRLIKQIAQDIRARDEYRKKLLLHINNIIEDAYIENAGASQFDNTGLFFKIFNTAMFLYGCTQKGAERIKNSEKEYTAQDKKNQKRIDLIESFLYIMYAQLKCGASIDNIRSRVLNSLYNKAKPLYTAAAVETDVDLRKEYIFKIFDILSIWLPEYAEQESSLPFINPKTHNGVKKSLSDEYQKRIPDKVKPLNQGKEVTETISEDNEKKLTVFLTKNCNEEENNEMLRLINEFIEQGKEVEFVEADDGYEIYSTGTGIHDGITLVERKYPSGQQFQKQYKDIVNRNLLLINKFKKRFYDALARNDYIKEEKQLMGHSLMSNRLWDSKGRYWIKRTQTERLPDLAVMLLLDGSGSMGGKKRVNAIFTSVVFSEVLEKNDITFSVAEHRSVYEGEVEVNVLKPFKSKAADKYNIMKYQADGGTRDGLTLLWVKDYFIKNADADKKLLIAITDGMPCDTGYYPPVSLADSHNSIEYLKKSGIDTVAIALVEDKYELNGIKTIYNNIVLCAKAEDLAAKTMEVVAKVLL